ncbi:MAG: Wzz/FepE/Etk N-terminal domain-containing protein [Telluria sp.]
MKQERATPPAPHTSGAELSLVDLLIILAERKKIIMILPLAVALLAVVVSLLLPNVYTASTKLLPPQQAQSGAAALLAQLGGAGGLAGGIAGVKSPSDIYIGMLMSRTVADKLVARFDLQKRYGLASAEKARRRLAENTVIVTGKDGMISISVDDEDRKLVAELTNAYVDELYLLTKTLAVSETSQRRLFFERQLEAAKDNLAKVEVALKGALDSGGVISVDSESLAILQTAARLRAQMSAKEIQIGSMRAFVTEQNPEYLRASEELRSLRTELSKLEGGRAVAAAPAKNQRAGLDNIQLMRDLKYYQMLYELLAKQYEVARLDEAKDAALIQVLDPAVEPEFKSKPKRALIVLSMAILGLFAALVWVFFAAARRRAMAVPADAARWNTLCSHLRFR